MKLFWSRKKSSQTGQQGPAKDWPDQADNELAQIDHASNVFSEYLCNLWKYLLRYDDQSDQKLALKDLEKLGIRHESLDLDSHGTVLTVCLDKDSASKSDYFTPMELAEFKTYSIDMDDAETKIFEKQYLCSWAGETASGHDNIDTAGELCTMLTVSFQDLTMKKEVGEKKSTYFEELTNWREIDHDKAFHYRAYDVAMFWEGKCKIAIPEYVWAAENKPHMMVTIAHEYAGNDDSLLVNEIRVITALMIVRLNNNSFPDENVVPVLAFSFTSNGQGRILQAYMDGKSLVIRKSDFLNFSGRRDASFNIFLRHMVCDLQAGPCMSGAMAQFNDEEKFEKSWHPCVLYGTICVYANFSHNQHLRKITVLNNVKSRASLSQDCDIVAAKWEYRELKRIMLNTLWREMGNYPVAELDRVTRISTLNAYREARYALVEIDKFLVSHQIEVSIDDFNEDLTRYTLDPPKRSKVGHLHRWGFLEAEPDESTFTVTVPPRVRSLLDENQLPGSLKRRRSTSLGLEAKFSSVVSTSSASFHRLPR